MDIKKLLIGNNKYTTGLLFLLASLLGFWDKMKEMKIPKDNQFITLFTIVSISYLLS